MLDLLCFYKIHIKSTQINKCNLPAFTINTKLRGNAIKYTYNHTRLSIRRHWFFNRVPRKFTKILDTIGPIKSYNSFKQYLLNQNLDNI